MATERFMVVFDGPALKDGGIDASDFAASLLGLGRACARANYLLNGTDARVELQLYPTADRRSFPADLTLVQNLADALFGEGAATPREILEYLGLASVAVAADQGAIQTIIDLWKRLHGEKPEIVEEKPEEGKVVININGDNNHVDVKVVGLYSDPELREAFVEMLEPLKAKGVDTWQSVHGGQVVRQITQEEARELRVRRWPEETGEKPIEEIVTAEVISQHFRDNYKWRFSSSDYGRFTANMVAKGFIDKLRRREEVLWYGDSLTMRMVTRFVRTEDGLAQERDIEEVLEVIHAPRQQQLA